MRFALLVILAVQVAHGLESVPKAVYRQRRVTLSQKIDYQAALLFAASETDYHSSFRQDNDFFYLTGWNQPGAVLLILAARPEYAQYPNYKRPYGEILFLPEKPAGSTGPALDARAPEAAESTGVDRVESITQLAPELIHYGIQYPGSLYSPMRHPTANATASFAWLQRNILGDGTPRDLTGILTTLRAVKDEFELDLIRKAAAASVAAHLAAMRALKPGVYEYEIAALMEYEFRRRGCERPAYASIAASGANSAFGHYTANGTRMQSGELVRLDIAGEYSMYAADVTRTLPVNGKYTDRQRELYRVVRGAELAVIQAFRAGESTLYGGAHSLENVYLEYLKSQHLAEFSHGGIGHTVGLNVHDGGETGDDYKTPLVPGNVFNIEPGVYLPAEKTGIAIEDTFWVDPEGRLVNLTAELPVEPEDIERAMAAGK
jgi:Xaa-Pro aminopeptidase